MRCTHLVVVRRTDKDDGTIVRDIESTSWPDLAEEDVGDGLPEEQSCLVDEVRMLGNNFLVFR